MGRYLACVYDGVLSVYSKEGGINPLKMCATSKKFSFSPRDTWLVAEHGENQMIIVNMSTRASRVQRISGNYSSSVWSDDEAFLMVNCEGSNYLRFFARETSDIFAKLRK